MPEFRWSNIQEERFEPDFCQAKGRTVLCPKIAVSQIVYPTGTDVSPHVLANEQIFVVMRGKAAFRVGTQEKTVGPGEAIIVRPESEFSVCILDEFEVLRFQDVGSSPPAPKASGPAFFKWEEMGTDFITPAYSSARGPVVTGERIEVTHMFFPAGTGGKAHSHPNEQIQVVVKGKARMLIGGMEHLTEPGMIIFIPTNIEHEGQMLEDYLVVNCKNIIQGWSVYHARWEK